MQPDDLNRFKTMAKVDAKICSRFEKNDFFTHP